MTYMSVTAGQMSSAAGYLVQNWGDYGYRFEGVETRTFAVSVFRVVCSDGGRFCIVADKWGNCRYLDTHGGDDGLSDVVDEMHGAAADQGDDAGGIAAEEPCADPRCPVWHS